MKLREAELGDEQAIIHLCSAISVAEGHENDVDLTIKDYTRFLSMDYEKRPFRCLVADDGIVVGMALWQEIFSYEQGPVMYVIAFAVDELARNRGVGNALFNKLKEIAFENKYPAIQLFVHKTNESARSFYRKQGVEIYDEWDFAEKLVGER
jgi:ribosomal protein S18 acetylase RimI-like enzyme